MPCSMLCFRFTLVCLIFFCSAMLSAATITVTSADDSGTGTLREAIGLANVDSTQDTIQFDGSVTTITLVTPLPSLTEPVIIDGGVSASYVELDGATNSVTSNGLTIAASTCEVHNLIIQGFAESGIYITGSSDDAEIRGNVLSANGTNGITINGYSNELYGNIIGLAADGVTSASNGLYGISVLSDAAGTIIGEDTVGGRNTISNNASSGIDVRGINTFIDGNYIGTDSSGSNDKGNGSAGVEVYFGHGTSFYRNVISGNSGRGIYATDTFNLVFYYNMIGMDESGTSAIPNDQSGLVINNCNSPQVFENVISSNGTTGTGSDRHGISVTGSSLSTVVYGNKVGTDIFGNTGFGNARHGISSLSDIYVAGDNWIFSNGEAGVELNTAIIGSGISDNRIGGNGSYGIYSSGSGARTIRGNIIGLDPGGTFVQANNLDGIFAAGTGDTTIGGTITNHHNVIVGNSGNGVAIANPNTTLQRNYIGTDESGSAGLGNTQHGVYISGTGAGAEIMDNVIAGNQSNGISSEADSVLISGNYIGTNSANKLGLSNLQSGIKVDPSTSGTIVLDNTIGCFVSYGIKLGGPCTIQGNAFGTDLATKTADFGTSSPAIYSTSTGAGAEINENYFAFIDAAALSLHSAVTVTSNTFENNLIGISLRDGGGNNTIGIEGEPNSFANNSSEHIFIGTGSTANKLTANIYDNSPGLVISFNGSVVPNDALDADTGANNRQNHPVIGPINNASASVSGNIDSEPDSEYMIQVYSNASAHSSGYGPGEVYLGSTTVTTDGTGYAAWSLAAGPFAEGTVITALATGPLGNTSHFSPAVTVHSVSTVSDWLILDQ